MKYLTQFETKAEYDSHIATPGVLLPNVSYVEMLDEVKYKQKVFLNKELTFRAMSDNCVFRLRVNPNLYSADDGTVSIDLQYRYNGGTWTDIDIYEERGLIIPMHEDDIVQLRGNNTTLSFTPNSEPGGGVIKGVQEETKGETKSKTNSLVKGAQEGSINFFIWKYMSGKWEVNGNIMSLIQRTNFSGLTSVVEDAFYAFWGGFPMNSGGSTPQLGGPLSFDNNFPGFVNAKNLVLPATTLGANCYQMMFMACADLVIAPAILPATTLSAGSYMSMFMGCSSLVKAPMIAATTLADSCCSYMFGMCSSLQTAPALLANTLVSGCYTEMFSDCTKLNYVKCLATPISSTPSRGYNEYTGYWLQDVAADGIFVQRNDAGTWSTGNSGIPCDWKVFDDNGMPLGIACNNYGGGGSEIVA